MDVRGDLDFRFSCVTSRIPDPDQLTHSGRGSWSYSRIPDPVCGGWLSDFVWSQCLVLEIFLGIFAGFGGLRRF